MTISVGVLQCQEINLLVRMDDESLMKNKFLILLIALGLTNFLALFPTKQSPVKRECLTDEVCL